MGCLESITQAISSTFGGTSSRAYAHEAIQTGS
jgi:hypothetical protein